MSGKAREGRRRSAPLCIAGPMLGRLARWLRLLGFDTAFSPDFSDADIARIARREGRIVLTRDRGLAARKAVTRCILIESQEYREQIAHVFRTLGLRPDAASIFSRCPACNRRVRAVPKEHVADEVPPYVYRTMSAFSRCPSCGNVFWMGSHHRRAMETVREIFGEQVR